MALVSSSGAKLRMLQGIDGLDTMIAIDTNGNVCSVNPAGASFTANTAGTLTLDSNVTLSITAGRTVAKVEAFDDTLSVNTPVITIDLSANESFPDGGNLIVEAFHIALGDL